MSTLFILINQPKNKNPDSDWLSPAEKRTVLIHFVALCQYEFRLDAFYFHNKIVGFL